MSTNTLTISSYRKIKPAFRKELPASHMDSSVAPVISMADKTDTGYTGRRQGKPVPVLNMPPLVRAYFKGRDNDPL